MVNKTIQGKQCTIVWWVDDLKVSHVQKEVINGIIEWLKDKYEDKDIGLMKLTCGKRHNFLGMLLDYGVKGEVKVDMQEYIGKMCTDFEGYLSTTMKKVKTLVAPHLFHVREGIKKLDKKRAKIFHNMIARGLFVTKRAKGDIHTAISCLTTRVREPNMDDWKKLQRLMQYLNNTKSFVSTLRADSMSMLKWFIDGSHGTHPDCKGHTGAALTLGKELLVTLPEIKDCYLITRN